MRSYVMTPASGKRLIARALAAHADVRTVLQSGTLVIVAGTTNGYVAEEILSSLGQDEGFSRQNFFRGITASAAVPASGTGRQADTGGFPGDVVIVNGVWQKGKQLADVAAQLKPGDMIMKGANALDLEHRRAALLIGHPQGGTILEALPAVVGRRVRLMIPVGLEKRVLCDLDRAAVRMNTPGCQGPRLLPFPGEVVTELEAIAWLTGCAAELVAAGGVSGAEGAVWLAVDGTAEQMAAVQDLMTSVTREPPFAR